VATQQYKASSLVVFLTKIYVYVFWISYVVLPVARGTTDTAGTLEIIEPAIAGRNVKLRFTPTNYSEPHALSLHFYNSSATNDINIQKTFNDTQRKNFVVSAVFNEADSNKEICVKYNSNTCKPKIKLTLIGRFVYKLLIFKCMFKPFVICQWYGMRFCFR